MSSAQPVPQSKIRKILLTYLYVASSCCLGFLLVGVSILLNLLVSYVAKNFAYNTQYSSLLSLRKNDLEGLIPCILFGGGFLAAHLYGLRITEPIEERKDTGLYFSFNALLATLSGATTMITGVIGINLILQALLDPSDGPYTPGPPIAFGIVFGVVWFYFFRNILRLLKERRAAR